MRIQPSTLSIALFLSFFAPTAHGVADGPPVAPTSCPEIGTAEATSLFERARAILGSTEAAGPASIEPAPEGEEPLCIVFLTSSEGGRGFTTLGRGANLDSATAMAAERQALHPFRRPGPEVRWLRLDIARPWTPPPGSGEAPVIGIGSIGPLEGAGEGNPGMLGLATSPAFEAAIHPEELLAYRMIEDDGRIRTKRLRAFFDRFPHRAPPAEANPEPTSTANPISRPGWRIELRHRFEVRSFLDRAFDGTEDGHGDGNGEDRGPRPLVRGNPAPGAWMGEGAERALLDSAIAAGHYLARTVSADGRYGYNYLPKTNRFSDGYNILRHAGTTYSLFELHRTTGIERFARAGERGLAYLRQQFRACPQDREALCVVEDGISKLGGNGLAILALLEHPRLDERPELLADARRLGMGIIALQQEDGRFEPHKFSWPGGRDMKHVSIYYPGEACFALARLTARTGEKRWLDAAIRGARWLIEVRDGALADDDLPHDHWLAYALREIERQVDADEDPSSAERRLYARRMAGAIHRAQLRADQGLPRSDWAGGFYQPPRSAPTSTRVEGLGAIVDLVVENPGPEKAADLAMLETTLCAATDFLLRTQFRPGAALFLSEPERVLGGFHRDLDSFDLRIDYSQHAISGLLGVARLIAADHLHCSP